MIDTDFTLDQLRLAKIFHPNAMRKMSTMREENTRFVHYTSASAAMKIIKTKTFWMRKTSCMNDFMEVKQGLHCLDEAYHGEAGKILQATLNGMFEGLPIKSRDCSAAGGLISRQTHTSRVFQSISIQRIWMDVYQCGGPTVDRQVLRSS